MKASELLIYLQNIIITHGDCNIYLWDSINLKHINIRNPKYIIIKDYDKKLGLECPEYKKDFENIIGNIII